MRVDVGVGALLLTPVAYLAVHICLGKRNKRRDDARQVIAVKEVAYAGLQLCVCCYGHCVAFIAVLTFTPTWENSMIDVDLARELIVLKAKDLGLEDEKLDQMDELVCELLGVEDADPLIFPS